MMLAALTRKLCPWMSVALVTISCGKKITDADSKPGNTIEESNRSSRFLLRLNTNEGYIKQANVPDDANFKIPEKLKVVSGSTDGKVIEIGYNVDPYDNNFYEYKCSYYPSSEGDEMWLGNCYDLENRSFGDVSDVEFFISQNQILEIKVLGSHTSDFIVEALYDMRWY